MLFLLPWCNWVLFFKSGIHSTIAGVLTALTIPIGRNVKTRTFYDKGNEILKNFIHECQNQGGDTTILNHKQLDAIDEMEELTEKTASPIQFLEHRLHGWIAYLIIPVFALANAGVVFSFSGDTNLALSTNIAISMVIVVIGNFIGIFSFSWLSIKFNIAELPQNVNFKQLAGVSILGGLGFTMSLFINNLAYTDQGMIDAAKIGILVGSAIAGTLGYIVLKIALKRAEKNEMS